MSTAAVTTPAPARVRPTAAAQAEALEQEKRRIQSPEFAAQLTAVFHQAKRRAIAQRDRTGRS